MIHRLRFWWRWYGSLWIWRKLHPRKHREMVQRIESAIKDAQAIYHPWKL